MTLDLVLIFPMLEDKLGFSDKLARYWASLAAWGALGIHLSLPAFASPGVPGTQPPCLASHSDARKLNSSLLLSQEVLY